MTEPCDSLISGFVAMSVFLVIWDFLDIALRKRLTKPSISL